jgi:hypothetical protein
MPRQFLTVKMFQGISNNDIHVVFQNGWTRKEPSVVLSVIIIKKLKHISVLL